jgi:hypothetical protein
MLVMQTILVGVSSVWLIFCSLPWQGATGQRRLIDIYDSVVDVVMAAGPNPWPARTLIRFGAVSGNELQAAFPTAMVSPCELELWYVPDNISSLFDQIATLSADSRRTVTDIAASIVIRRRLQSIACDSRLARVLRMGATIAISPQAHLVQQARPGLFLDRQTYRVSIETDGLEMRVDIRDAGDDAIVKWLHDVEPLIREYVADLHDAG